MGKVDRLDRPEQAGAYRGASLLCIEQEARPTRPTIRKRPRCLVWSFPVLLPPSLGRTASTAG